MFCVFYFLETLDSLDPAHPLKLNPRAVFTKYLTEKLSLSIFDIKVAPIQKRFKKCIFISSKRAEGSCFQLTYHLKIEQTSYFIDSFGPFSAILK